MTIYITEDVKEEPTQIEVEVFPRTGEAFVINNTYFKVEQVLHQAITKETYSPVVMIVKLTDQS